IQASGPPAEDPFATEAAAAPAPVRATLLSNAPLAGQPTLESIASGKGVLKKGAQGEGVKALQSALISLGVDVPGGADGIFGAGREAAVRAMQATMGQKADGIVGSGTLKALDARLGTLSQRAPLSGALPSS